jgi:GTP-dependent phosphoenolpyruvate carboxykinase
VEGIQVTSSSEEFHFPLNIGKPSQVVPVWKYMCLPSESDTQPFRIYRMILACNSAISRLLPAFVRHSIFSLCMTMGSNASTTALYDIQKTDNASALHKQHVFYMKGASVALAASHNNTFLTLVSEPY